MTIQKLVGSIKAKSSFLCVGLDTDIHKIPLAFKRYSNPVLTFNKAVIDATNDLCVSYKINTAFYEANGAEGWHCMHDTLACIPPDIFSIADAKRGDIGNTAAQYAKTFFESLNFDSITLSPYMGVETLKPFLEYDDKTIIVLGLTSNKGAQDFEMLKLDNGQRLYESVISQVAKECPAENTMFVIGATQEKQMAAVRKLVPNHFFLVPGVGTQGGSLSKVFSSGKSENVGLLVNVSRSIIYAGNEMNDPIKGIREAAESYQKEMQVLLNHA